MLHRYDAPLISIEGLDGSGKSTVVEALAQEFPEALILREPGGTPLSELLRAVLKHLPLPDCPPEQRALKAPAMALTLQLKREAESAELKALAQALVNQQPLPFEAVSDAFNANEELLLFNIARAQLIQDRVIPALLEGTTVILDRFYDSTVAYQGFGRGLDPDHIEDACLNATDGLSPNLTLYLRISPETRIQRISGRGKPDRIERSGEEFFERVVAGFDALAKLHANRFVVINAERSPDQVRVDSLKAISAYKEQQAAIK